jgi:predicted chitinase
VTMNPSLFFKEFRSGKCKLFGNSLSQNQVNGINGILEAFKEVGDGRRATLAYALATAYHETGRAMVPNREDMNYTTAKRIFEVFGPRRIASLQEAEKYIKRPRDLSNRVYNGMLGNRMGSDDGWRYRGGGHPHLTGRDNYARSSVDAGVDLVENPEAMLDPRISARVLILGLLDGRWNARREGITHYEMLDGMPGLSELEAIAARRTVNIQDRAKDISGYYQAFDKALIAAGMPEFVRQPLAAKSVAVSQTPIGEQQTSRWDWVANSISRVFGFLSKGGPA